jgi:hypothetical protein
MPLLFLALAFFYGLLSLLPLVIRERASRPVPEVGAAVGEQDVTSVGAQPAPAVRLAAAVAVALARAEVELDFDHFEPRQKEGGISPWWAGHHQRHLTDRAQTRRNL